MTEADAAQAGKAKVSSGDSSKGDATQSKDATGEGPADAKEEAPTRRDLFEVLGVEKTATEDEIKSAYKKLALRYHPDKNVNDPSAAEKFKELAFAYSVLSDADRRHKYVTGGFQAVETEDMDVALDLSGLGTFTTAVVALFNKLGVPIKTSVSATVLEEAQSGSLQIRTLPLGKSVSDKVERQSAHFYAVTLTEEAALQGVAVRATSNVTGKFKLLYFEWQSSGGGLDLAMQDSSIKVGKLTLACFFFLGFQAYTIDPSAGALEMAREPDLALFRRLDGLQRCEVKELKAGTHVFAVYGDNFFKTTQYTIEAVPVPRDTPVRTMLQEVDTKLLAKKESLRQFEIEFRQTLKKYEAAVVQYEKERVELEELLDARTSVVDQFSCAKLAAHSRLSWSPTKASSDDSSQTQGELGTASAHALGGKKWFSSLFGSKGQSSS